jgi:poly(3-hydroxyalkanoate) synthetase
MCAAQSKMAEAEFYVRQITNAIAPTNFVLTNSSR